MASTEKMISVDVDQIITTDATTLTSLQAVRSQWYISSFLQVLLQTLTIDSVATILPYLEWIEQISKALAVRTHQPFVTYTKPTIVRSSYDFCEDGCRCTQFYTVGPPVCHRHHFVHHILRDDVESVIRVLKRGCNAIELKSITCSVKTITYVTRRMQGELEYLEQIGPDAELYHRHNVVRPRRKERVVKPRPAVKRDDNFFKVLG